MGNPKDGAYVVALVAAAVSVAVTIAGSVVRTIPVGGLTFDVSKCRHNAFLAKRDLKQKESIRFFKVDSNPRPRRAWMAVDVARYLEVRDPTTQNPAVTLTALFPFPALLPLPLPFPALLPLPAALPLPCPIVSLVSTR